MMEVHKVTLYIIDHDEIGKEGVKEILEITRYPNRCILPTVLSIESRDIGEWDDNHPLNMIDIADEYCRKLFDQSAEQER